MEDEPKERYPKDEPRQDGGDGKLPPLPEFFRSIGINSPYTLYSASLKGQLDELAKRAEIDPYKLERLVEEIGAAMPDDVKKVLQDEAMRPVVTGHIDWTDPQQKHYFESLGIHERKPLSREAFDKIALRPLIPYRIPRGPIKSVDLRPFLGDARSQQGRGTCAVFAGTAVAEAFEYFRDRRPGTIDLSEEFVWWYRGAGQRYSAGGYDCGAAIDDIRDVGVSEEYVLPYNGTQINDNHTQVPIADLPIDRAQFYRTGDALSLPDGDVNAVKRVIESGRCVCYGSNLDGWNTGTGEISMPPAGTAKGASHCTTIVGYIDRDDLPAAYGGGFLIIRNSWGGAGSVANVMGPEYGGHLLMPYAWYRLYAGWAHTAMDKNDGEHRSQWLVEYYENRELRGAPLESKTITTRVLFFDIHTDVELPQEVGDVNFDWGFGSPVKYVLPLFGERDVLPTDNFSVRFSKVIRFREGWYRFHLRADDGVRLYLDDRLVINEWKDQPDTAFSAEHYLTGGDHIVKIEYYEAGGTADVHFSVEPIVWHYELFASHDLGTPTDTFDDTLTLLEWRHASPVPGLLTNGRFGLRGTATLSFRGGDYRFYNFSTGQLNISIDGVRVAELLNDGDSQELFVDSGSHRVTIEFLNTTTIPAMGSQSYYRARCNFGWSEQVWNAQFYKNDRCDYYANHWAELFVNPDAAYIFARTLGLAGPVRHQHEFPVGSAIDNNLSFPDWNSFKTADWPAGFEQKFWGVWINRRIALDTTGLYNVTLDANEVFRLVIDGKEIVQNQYGIGPSPYNADIFLERGMHDVSIEYNPTQWGGNLNFHIEPALWRVDYFLNTDLQGAATTQFLPVADVVSQASAAIGRSSNFSARISRTVFLPLGKYAFAVTSDDGVRLKINNRLLIDAWHDQPATAYSATYEHLGGDLSIQIEYYQGGGDARFDFSIHATDFYAEYYNTRTLNEMPAGVERPRVTPIAYRYDGDINFDWGAGSQLPRVGATDFSARWRGKIRLPVGRWRIEASSDDGIRVYIGGRLVINHWHPQPLTTHSRMIDLTGREHDVMVEYFQQAGSGACKVKYKRVI